MAPKIDFNALRAQTLGRGQDEEAVTVNTRALIDKVLARYSGEWTVLRELLQNAADAGASTINIRFETSPSTKRPLPQGVDNSELLKHTISHRTLRSLKVGNDGKPFGEDDWQRLKRIAEGNPDETKIGAFGVGFYSVFADCEEPFISSGSEAMAFYWKSNSLFTKRLQLDQKDVTNDTTFVLDYRNNTTSVPSLLPLCQFLASSMTFVGLASIELWLDEWKLLSLTKTPSPSSMIAIPAMETKSSEGYMRVSAVIEQSVQLEGSWMNIIFWKRRSGTPSNAPQSESKSQPSQSLKSFFSRFSSGHNPTAEKQAKEEKDFQHEISEALTMISNGKIFWTVYTAEVKTFVSKNFAAELTRATKKPPPSSTKIAMLLPVRDSILQDPGQQKLEDNARRLTVFASVLPVTAGKVFIGFPTHQTTGLLAHFSAQSIIPTVERESIDLQARFVRTWNMELLRCAGILSRIAWTAQMSTLKQRLNTQVNTRQRTLTNSEIEAVIPQSLHILDQFTFRETTPSDRVGALIEEAFWTCGSTSVDILSSRGILPSQDVRLSSQLLSFVEGIPLLPSALMSSPFVKKLSDYGVITEITTADIKKELERQPLNPDQLVEFLRYLIENFRNGKIDSLVIKSLLDVALANEETNGRTVLVVLGSIEHFLNPGTIPGSLPTPPNTMPFRFTMSLNLRDLELLGWTTLHIVPYVRWICEKSGTHALSPDQDVENSPAFASRILQLISKQWESLSGTAKETIVELLRTRSIIPTKLGLRKPADAYFASVKLFDDLPTVHGLPAVKEKVLAALGVRKTIELNLIFERLMSQSSSEKPDGKIAWSHIELIKYLASVRADIPTTDIKRLKETPICQVEDPATRQQRYRISDLYEPTEQLRSLGLPLLQWPGTLRAESSEGKFLFAMGLRRFPTVDELVGVVVHANTAANFQLRDRTLKYFADCFHQHGYSPPNRDIAFLPIENENPGAISSPAKCFTNKTAALMGFSVLRGSLHQHASKLGVDSNPPILDCVNWLIKNPPQTHREATLLFEYFTIRIHELNGRPAALLSQANFVPVSSKSSVAEKPRTRHLSPSMVFLGEPTRFGAIVDFVSFGQQANAFLLNCGAKNEPTTTELCKLIIKEPARVLTTLETPEKYLELLRVISTGWQSIKKDKTMVRDLKRVPCLLAYKESSVTQSWKSGTRESSAEVDDDVETIKTFELATGDATVIIDDAINYNLFKEHLLACPMDDDLESLYASLGASTLSSLIEERPSVGEAMKDQRDADKLRILVKERIPLFFHDVPREKIKHDFGSIDNSMRFVMVKSLSMRKSLTSRRVSHTRAIHAVALTDKSNLTTLYYTHGVRDHFEIARALLGWLLYRPTPQFAIVLMTLLDTDLAKLKARGYNVDRILNRKAQQARIAEEQRKRQLEQEQESLKAMEHAAQSKRAEESTFHQNQSPMPGFFPGTSPSDDPPHRPPPEESKALAPAASDASNLFSNWTKTLRGLRPSTPQPPQPPPPYTESTRSTEPSQQVANVSTPSENSPLHLQQNLLNAIKSSRSHKSSTLTSQPAMNEIKDTSSFCDSRPAQDLELVGQSANGIKIYLSRTSSLDVGTFMARNSSALNDFASILTAVAEAYSLALPSLHIFAEENSTTIAFNTGRALFFNYRYFERLHLPDVQQGHAANAVVYWAITVAHELAHNIVEDHSASHSYYTESFVTRYFARIAAKASEAEEKRASSERLVEV